MAAREREGDSVLEAVEALKNYFAYLSRSGVLFPVPTVEMAGASETPSPRNGRGQGERVIQEQVVPPSRELAEDPSRESLEGIRTDLGECTRCKLHKGRKSIVYGVGNPKARIVFVGEGPGADEDEQGLPFVGRAGQLLTRMLKALGVKREDVYICNVVKCRPPNNRPPEPDEVSACSPFLLRQIRSIRPRVVCALGSAAMQTLLQATGSITKLRGQVFEWQGTKLIPTFHPAYLLRNPRSEFEARADIKKALDLSVR